MKATAQLPYVMNLESDEPIMLINKHVGMSDEDGMGIDGAMFQESLMALDGMNKKRIQVYINSVGGVVMDGYNICSAILKTKTPVDTYCMGMAASIAGVIFQCGRKRIMADYGILMYHNPSAGDITDSPLLNSMKESINAIIRNKSKMSPKKVAEMMDRTSFIQAGEALKMNLCDVIENSVHLNTKYLPKNLADTRTYWAEANSVINRLFTNTSAKMEKVINKLGLTAEATEDNILEAIEAVQNSLTKQIDELKATNKAAEDALAEKQSAMDAAEEAYNKAKEELEKCKNDLEQMKAEKEEADKAAAEEKATNLVTNAVREGRIRNEAAVIASWKAKAVEDFEGTKTLLGSIATNKAAVKFELDKGDKAPASMYKSVASDMLEISNRLGK